MSGKRVIHDEYGPGEVTLYTYVGPKPVVCVRFDGLVDEVLLDRDDPKLKEQMEENNIVDDDHMISGIKGYDDVAEMDSEILIKAFEDLVRKCAGSCYVKVVWMRKEIMRRIGRGEHL